MTGEAGVRISGGFRMYRVRVRILVRSGVLSLTSSAELWTHVIGCCSSWPGRPRLWSSFFYIIYIMSK